MTKQPNKIRTLLSKTFETLLAKIVAGLILLAIPLGVLTEYLTDYVWYPILNIFLWIIGLLQSQVMAWHLLVVIIGSYLFIRMFFRTIGQPKPVVPKEPKHYFIERGGYKWKVNRYDGSVDYRPFCKEHQVKLSEYHHECPICERKHSGYLNDSDFRRIHDEVSRIADAQVAGYFKS